jgi:hypothetical protein
MIHDTPAPASRSGGSLRRWALVLVGFLLLPVLLLAVLIGPDQVRPVAEASVVIAPFAEADASEGLENGREKHVPAELEQEGKMPPSAEERFIEYLRPIPDTSSLPDHLQAPAREWNQKNEELARALYRQWMAAMQEEDSGRHFATGTHSSWLHLWRHYHERFPPSSYADHGQRWHDTYLQVRLATAVEHENWMDAASLCATAGWRASKSGDKEREDTSWDEESGYLRKGGWKERYRLAQRSLKRRVDSILESAEETPSP